VDSWGKAAFARPGALVVGLATKCLLRRRTESQRDTVHQRQVKVVAWGHRASRGKNKGYQGSSRLIKAHQGSSRLLKMTRAGAEAVFGASRALWQVVAVLSPLGLVRLC